MRSLPRCIALGMVFLVLLVLLAGPAAVLAGPTVKSANNGDVVLAGAGRFAADTVFEVKSGDDLLGFLLAQDEGKGGIRVKLIAGKTVPGAEALPIERPKIRVGFLGGEEGRRVKKELSALCPNRVAELRSTDELDPKRLDAAVITSVISEQPLRRFVTGGGTAIVDLATYAAWSGAQPKEVVSDKTLSVEVVAATNATRGLAVGQTFAHYGSLEKRYRCRCLASVRDGGRVLLALAPNQEPVAVEHSIGGGRLLVLDLLSPNGEPGYDVGSVLKWVLPGNLLARSVRYVPALSRRLDYDDYMRLQESVAARVEHQWVREKVGVDSSGKTIRRFRTGPLDQPILLFDGAIHGGEWLNPYLLLDFIQYLANVPEDDYKTWWVLRNFTVAVIPMLNGSMRQESFSGCGDLNRNFDFRWEDYTKG